MDDEVILEAGDAEQVLAARVAPLEGADVVHHAAPFQEVRVMDHVQDRVSDLWHGAWGGEALLVIELPGHQARQPVTRLDGIWDHRRLLKGLLPEAPDGVREARGATDIYVAVLLVGHERRDQLIKEPREHVRRFAAHKPPSALTRGAGLQLLPGQDDDELHSLLLGELLQLGAVAKGGLVFDHINEVVRPHALASPLAQQCEALRDAAAARNCDHHVALLG
mmetsp:Transcript_43847/g.113221  ORF Transcript_43847/g.113221 Transcript_43847/m.113221 type:complete len:222 (-) Transcript_43847:2106-2771(-)